MGVYINMINNIVPGTNTPGYVIPARAFLPIAYPPRGGGSELPIP